MVITPTWIIGLITAYIASMVTLYKLSTSYTDSKIDDSLELTNARFNDHENRFSELKDNYAQRIDDLKEDIKELKQEMHSLRKDNVKQNEKVVELLQQIQTK